MANNEDCPNEEEEESSPDCSDNNSVCLGKSIKGAECLDLVRFVVSEYIYVCHKSTILKYPDSKLAELIKPENDPRKSGSDHIVIDRNGKLFGVILRLMRNSADKCWEDLEKTEIDDLVEELVFLQLDILKKYVEKTAVKLNDVTVGLLEAGKNYIYDEPTILIMPASLKAFGEDWRNMSKQLRSSRKFSIWIDDLNYRRTVDFNDEPEVFRFFSGSEDKRNNLPRLFAEGHPASYGDLIFETRTKRSKDNFLKFLIAVDMFLNSTSTEELLAVEKRIPGVKLKRHPKASS
uniref:Potassium channel tetramerisation-type BTB domain-containing protein n=1 Tax=Aceria tosichella TaxID=561515 RepID=A0A6G1S429_9ACAR